RGGLYQRGQAASRVGLTRMPALVCQRGAVRQEATGRGREVASACQRGQTTTGPAVAVIETVVLRFGPSACEPGGWATGPAGCDPQPKHRTVRRVGLGRRVRGLDPEAFSGDTDRLVDPGGGVTVSGAATIRGGHPP